MKLSGHVIGANVKDMVFNSIFDHCMIAVAERATFMACLFVECEVLPVASPNSGRRFYHCNFQNSNPSTPLSDFGLE